MAALILPTDFPLLTLFSLYNLQLGLHILLHCAHLLNPTAWLQIYVDSLAAFSNFLSVSCEMVQDLGGVVENPELLAISLWLLLSFADSLYQQETEPVPLSLLGCSPWHLATLTKWSLCKTPALKLLDG